LYCYFLFIVDIQKTFKFFIKAVIKENPFGKKPLDIPRLRWEDRIKKDVKAVEPNIHRSEVTEEKERWRQIYLQGWP